MTEPGEFSQLEVPQLVNLDGHWRLLFCTSANDYIVQYILTYRRGLRQVVASAR